jgi:hypothetical protein
VFALALDHEPLAEATLGGVARLTHRGVVGLAAVEQAAGARQLAGEAGVAGQLGDDVDGGALQALGRQLHGRAKGKVWRRPRQRSNLARLCQSHLTPEPRLGDKLAAAS